MKRQETNSGSDSFILILVCMQRRCSETIQAAPLAAPPVGRMTSLLSVGDTSQTSQQDFKKAFNLGTDARKHLSPSLSVHEHIFRSTVLPGNIQLAYDATYLHHISKSLRVLLLASTRRKCVFVCVQPLPTFPH